MFRLRVAKGKKSGARYMAIVYVNGDNVVFLTFDTIAILKVTGKSLNDLNALDYGDYVIGE